MFQQSGGINTAHFVSIGNHGQYKYTGGSLQIEGGFENRGILDFDGSSAVINVANSILNFAKGGSVVNAQAATLTLGAHSLLIVSDGFNPAAVFGSYSNAGLTHTAGTTLTISSGQSIVGCGSIDDPVNCQGSISSVGSTDKLQLNNGLVLSGTGNVNCGYLRIEDGNSQISSGSLSTYYTYLGYNSTANGICQLSGTGLVNSGNEYIGYSGTGTFIHSAGANVANAVFEGLCIGYNTGASGTYILNGTGALQAHNEYIGYYGTGTLMQSGGTNSGLGSNSELYLGYKSGACGTYILSGSGQLSIKNQIIGYLDTGVFNQSGGINTNGTITLGNYSVLAEFTSCVERVR